MGVSLDQIKSLAAIAEKGSFAAAAEALNKAQSAVSYDIKQLEGALGIKVFDRKGYRAVLTSEGQAILREGQFLIGRLQQIETLARRFHEGWESRLDMIIDGILPMEPIMRVLKTLTEEGVPTQIQLKVEFLGGVQNRFTRERADIMLVKEYVPSTFLVAAPLPEVTCCLVAASDHALFKENHGDRVSLRDLRRHVELSIHDSIEGGPAVDRHAFGCSRIYYLSDFYTKRQALLMGLGFGWMPHYLIRDDLTKGLLKQIPYQGDPQFSFTPHLVYPANRPLGKTGTRILEMLKKVDLKKNLEGNQT